MLLPDLGPSHVGPPPVSAYHARVVGLLGGQRLDPANPGGGYLPDVRVLVLEGPFAGRDLDAYLEAPGGSQVLPQYRTGDEVLVTLTEQPSGAPFVAVSDRWRLPLLGALLALFVLVVVAAARSQGVRALLGLALSAVVVVRILVPELLNGVPPVPLAVGLALVLTVAMVGLSEGLSRAAVAAILGTAAGLGLTALLSAITVSLAGFTAAAGSELVYLQTAGGTALDLRGLLLAAFIIGSLGILNDVTVSQAATVEQLAHDAGLHGRALYWSASRVGRSHIGAAITTLFLAYAGASLPLLVLFSVTGQPAGLILNGEAVATELVRTVVGGIGLVAAVPIATLVATWLMDAEPAVPGIVPAVTGNPRPSLRSAVASLRMHPVRVLAVGLVLVVAVTGVGGLALGSAVVAPTAAAPTGVGLAVPGPGESLPAYITNPTGSATPAVGPPASPAATPSAAPIPVYAIHDVVDLASIGGQPVTVEVVSVRAAANGTNRTVDVELRFTSQVPLEVDPVSWILLTDGGIEYAPIADTSPNPQLRRTTLMAGHPLVGWLGFAAKANDRHGFLELLDGTRSPLLAISIY